MTIRNQDPFAAVRGHRHHAFAWAIAASIALLWLLFIATARATPVLDTLFGMNGIARIGGASGAEDFADAAARMTDGRIVIAGRSQGRASHNFAIRLTAAGQLDPTFGQGGVALLDPELVLGNIRQVAVRADGAVLIGGFDGGSAFIVRLTANGTLDPAFGTNGIARKNAPTLDTVWFVQQPDARLLVVTASYHQPTLRITRLDANGATDVAFGERVITAPGDVYASELPLAEDGDGGFVALMYTFVRLPDGSILGSATSPFTLLRVTGDGTLDSSFGTGGFVASADLGIPFGWVRDIERGAGDTWLVATTRATEAQGNGTPFLLRLGDSGTPDAAFGVGGRLQISATEIFAKERVRVVPLSDGGALVSGSGGGNPAYVTKVTTAGTVDANYGQAGLATVNPAGYQALALTTGFAEPGGAAKFVATLSRVLNCTTFCFDSGRDAGVIALTATGQLATGYGRGDGIAAWDRSESSTDAIDSLYTLPSGAVVVAGTSSASGTFKLLVARFGSDGKADAAFGTTGRVLASANARCYGPLQAAGQPGGTIAAAAGAAAGSLCNIGVEHAFRLDPGGTPMSFAPTFAAPDAGNATDALVARPDGRLVHATVNSNFSLQAHVVIVDQALPDGTPDPQFGVNGRATLAIPANGASRNASLALLPDGTLIAATVTAHGLALFKLDAAGKPVAGFGAGGTVFVPGEFAASSGFGRAVGIAVMEDTSLYVQYDAATSLGADNVKALRLSASGAILSTLDLPADTSRATFAALADDSIVIAGRLGDSPSTIVLRRLLRNDTFDPAFGPGGMFPVPQVTSVAALATTVDGSLILGGADPTSSLLLRFTMSGVVAPATVVEFHHATLDHYFVTANPQEAAAVDAGAAGPGWSRTGLTFRSGGANKVCRFYGNLAPNPATGLPFGPNSHFYTATPSECAFLLSIFTPAEKSWHFESYDFATTPPALPAGTPDDAATCPAGTLPVYRAYNRGFERGEDSNHRLTSSLPAYQATVARGWAGEGIRMCAPPDVTTAN